MSTGIEKNPSAPQAPAEIVSALRRIPVALLSDNMHRSCGSVGLQPYHRPAPLAGTAVTVRTRGGDNLAVLRAFEFCRPGDVMVVDAGGDITNAIVGGILTFQAASMGLAGMVIDGALVRFMGECIGDAGHVCGGGDHARRLGGRADHVHCWSG